MAMLESKIKSIESIQVDVGDISFVCEQCLYHLQVISRQARWRGVTWEEKEGGGRKEGEGGKEGEGSRGKEVGIGEERVRGERKGIKS